MMNSLLMCSLLSRLKCENQAKRKTLFWNPGIPLYFHWELPDPTTKSNNN